ncbi:hypothetical protein Fmac_033001 [Flemingia macrophylla]|uniref:Secreted protein n=1 Tax=Flemingia macrophylla TaxID=520843 RepID=A0ABD1L6J1_9FABA
MFSLVVASVFMAWADQHFRVSQPPMFFMAFTLLSRFLAPYSTKTLLTPHRPRFPSFWPRFSWHGRIKVFIVNQPPLNLPTPFLHVFNLDFNDFVCLVLP